MLRLFIICAIAFHIAPAIFALQCKISDRLRAEIHSYAPTVDLIKRAVVDDGGPLKNVTWFKLLNFVDDFGSRIAGSQNLEDAIDNLLVEFKSAKLDNVHGENVTAPHWVRGQESATLLKPRNMKLSMLGLGSSVGTPPEGITAEAIVIRSFEELKLLGGDKVRGKIVVFNPEFVSYDETVVYRNEGATEASRLGAVATLIRSITPFSIGSPHTGQQDYGNVTAIPAACIAVEQAQILQRLYNRGKKLVINMKMEAHNESPATTRNVVAEVSGKSKPEEVVIVSGHIDTWDVGQGAMDDGGGAFISWMSLVVLKTLGLKPKRTVRSILWTAEEEGYYGAKSYVKQHANELKNIVLAIESDLGTFTPKGFVFNGTEEAACIMQEIVSLLAPFNATTFDVSPHSVESDISVLQDENIPCAGLLNDNRTYFWYHHSDGDTMAVEDPKNLDLCVAVFASVSYIVADLNERLPRL